MELARNEFTTCMLRIYQANSSGKWDLMIKNAQTKKSDLILSTYVQNVEDFKIWANVAERLHGFPKRKSQKRFVSKLKPDIFREEIFLSTFELR